MAMRWIIANLRNRRFFSLFELKTAIRELVTAFNDRVTRHLGASRRALFEELERPELKPLPAEPYTFAEWKECKLGLDYHVEVEEALLLRAAHPDARDDVGHIRGSSCRCPCALLVEPQAHHGSRAHAIEPSALRRLYAGAPEAPGRRDRAEHVGAGRDHPA